MFTQFSYPHNNCQNTKLCIKDGRSNHKIFTHVHIMTRNVKNLICRMQKLDIASRSIFNKGITEESMISEVM